MATCRSATASSGQLEAARDTFGTLAGTPIVLRPDVRIKTLVDAPSDPCPRMGEATPLFWPCLRLRYVMAARAGCGLGSALRIDLRIAVRRRHAVPGSRRKRREKT